MIKDGTLLGYSWHLPSVLFFFGTRHVARSALSELFPALDFCFLKQIHGNRVIEASLNSMHEADGHFTDQPGRALVIQTADCVPLMLVGPTQICALHAGWRSATLNIVEASRKTMPMFNPQLAALGPHIAQCSFEVGHDVAQSLLQALPPIQALANAQLAQSLPNGKVLFDLKGLLLAQLKAAYGSQLNVSACDHDTKTDLQFHSFRRDRERAERQYSFVVINR